MKKLTFSFQTESSECGLACLAMIASHYGHQNDLADLRRQFSISLKALYPPETINAAERVVALRDGLSVEVRAVIFPVVDSAA